MAGSSATGAGHAMTTSIRTLSIALRRFATDATAATSIEYAIIAAGLSIVIAAAVQAIGGNLNATFTSVATGLK
jgi:pilus assembly protein Flp/PilA